MRSDPLSEILDLVEIQGVMSTGIAADGAWVARGPLVDHPLKFVAVARGSVRLTTDDGNRPLLVESGEVAILNNRSWMEVRGGDDDVPPREIDVSSPGYNVHDDATDVVFGGHITLNAIGRSLLLQTLPPVAHVRAASTTVRLRDGLDRLLAEMSAHRMGAGFAVRQHAQLVVLDMLRVYLDQAELPPGRLRVLTDERLHNAVALMHAEPGRAWRLATLAQAAAMSRTAFATRFRAVAGIPPLTYLNRWRMLLAQQALRTGDTQVGALASALGYTSDSAFSTAFKREVGESPLRYRKRAQEEAAELGGQAPIRSRAFETLDRDGIRGPESPQVRADGP
ncbi:AraC family transcriptional regulator [Nocardia sp. NPDC058499]|uniref:AraC family transcriptional regulator n=1 Tax=Nocardia sp. NPDC058499 TaxID=3346530 RepID=UPI003647B2DB